MRTKQVLRKYVRRTVFGVSLWIVASASATAVELFHIHGLGFSADGKRLYVPAHYGLVLYEDGRWRRASGQEHDYMGFVTTREAMYSSGHPAQGSNLVNPFGLMKSRDQGATWMNLGMQGEADFHVLAASHDTGVVFVNNLGPNSRISWTGLAVTSDDGKTWQRPKQAGFPTQPIAIAVHPKRTMLVAAAAEDGLFLSQDGGNTFEHRIGRIGVYGLWFDLDGQSLWYGGIAFSPFLAKLDLSTQKTQYFELPEIGRDAVAYIAQNPINKNEYAIATFGRDVYLSSEGGKKWRQLARQGETL